MKETRFEAGDVVAVRVYGGDQFSVGLCQILANT